MARDKFNTVIDGHRYEMTMLGATQGYKLFHKLVRMLGPSIGLLIDMAKDAKSGSKSGEDFDVTDIDLASDTAVKAINALLSNVSDKDIEHLIATFKECTHVGIDGSDKTAPIAKIFEAHFAGNFTSMYKWIYWGLTVQYGNFIAALASSKLPGEGVKDQVASSPSQ